MSDLTSYDLTDDGYATITMDDGKVNALSIAMLTELQGRLEQAEEDGAVVILTGRERTFSAGFDLKSEDWPAMLKAGAQTAQRMLTFPRPVVVACNGNALAMGAFLLLSGDVRIGVAGSFKLGLNEVQIGMTLPYFGIALAKHRLTRPYYDRATVTGAIFGPEEATQAGFLDRTTDAEQLMAEAIETAKQLTTVNMEAHVNTKLRIREPMLGELQAGIDRIDHPENGV